MDNQVLCCVALCLLGAGTVGGRVTQTPKYLFVEEGQEVTLECEQDFHHDDMYWYRQDPGQGLTLIYYSVGEGDFQKGDLADGYTASREKKASFPLTVTSARQNQSALHLCASSADPGWPLNFGTGTRLTVTDDLSKVNPPKVTVFEPSEAEIARTQKATLVCLATGFYPDHVELSWWVNGKKVQSGVSTDPQAYKEQPSQSDSRYRLSSRLRVSATFWHNPRNRFRCQVEFHGISDEDARSPGDSERVTQNVSAETRGKADCGFTAKSYQQGLLSATILYEILLGKATLYAVLVSALVLMAMVKRKDS